MEIKILNIITSGLKREGIATTQLEFIRNMDMSGIRMDMLAVRDNEESVIRDFERNGCRVIVMPDRQKEAVKYCRALYRLMKKNKYDIIHVHGSSALLAMELCIARLCGIKVRIAHSRNTTCNNKKKDKLLRPLFYSSYTDAFACGRDAGEWLFGGREFTVIHNGKDLEKFRYSENDRNRIRSEYGLDGKLVIGNVGSLNEQKNQLFLLDIFNIIHTRKPNSVLFLIGEGRKRGEIEKKISEYGLDDSIVLTGRISNVHEMLNAMDIMMLPSLHEGLPNVVLEWQASGLMSFVADTVTDECKVTELVRYLPIDCGAEIWADAAAAYEPLQDRRMISEAACEELRKANFEIKANAEFVKNKYVELIKQ